MFPLREIYKDAQGIPGKRPEGRHSHERIQVGVLVPRSEREITSNTVRKFTEKYKHETGEF